MARRYQGRGPNVDVELEPDRDEEDMEGMRGADPDGEDAEPETEDEREERRRLEDLHEEFLEEFNGIQSALKQERQDCLDDRRFIGVTGAQWEGYRKQFGNRAQLEVDKVSQAVDQIVEDYEDNRIDVEYVSKDGALDTNLADACASMHRSDAQDSSGAAARGNAFREMTAGGIGAYILETKYEDDDYDDEDDDADPHAPQRICIRPIHDADRFVFFDLDAKEQNKSDALTCYVIATLTYREYERRYPKDDPSNWPDTVHGTEYDWLTPDVVHLATVYRVERVRDVECFYRPPMAEGEAALPSTGAEMEEVSYFKSELEEDSSIAKDLKAQGWKKDREVKKKRKRIRKYVMNGMRILKDCGYIAGREIPVVMVYGHRCFIDNVERARGHVRKLKDAQRIKNMLLSSLAELSARVNDETPIVTTEQYAGHDIEWAEHSQKPAPVLTLNPVIGPDGQKQHLGPVGKLTPQMVPPATAALHQQIDMDLKEMSGNPNEGEKVVSHTSGKGIKAIQRRVDRKSSLYIHNMGIAIQWEAKIWLGMAPDVYYQKGRKLRGIGPRQETRQIELNRPVVGKTGGLTMENDLSRARFDVAVSVGPSSDSQREASFEAIVDVLALIEDPQTKLIVTHYALMNMRGEAVEPMREWARQSLIQNGVPGFATPEEAEALAEAEKNKQPPAIDQLALAQAQESMAKIQKLLEEVKLVAAKTEETRVNTQVKAAESQVTNAKTIADADLASRQAQVDAAKSLHDMKIAEQQSMQPSSGNGPQGQGNS